MQLISNRINGIDYFPIFSLHAIENHVLFPIGSRLFGKDDLFLIIQTPVLYTVSLLSPSVYYTHDFRPKIVSDSLFKVHNYFLKIFKNFFLTLFYATFKCGRYNVFKKILKNFFAPQNIEKLPKKVAHNPTRPPVFSPASFCFVKLRQF